MLTYLGQEVGQGVWLGRGFGQLPLEHVDKDSPTAQAQGEVKVRGGLDPGGPAQSSLLYTALSPSSDFLLFVSNRLYLFLFFYNLSTKKGTFGSAGRTPISPAPVSPLCPP